MAISRSYAQGGDETVNDDEDADIELVREIAEAFDGCNHYEILRALSIFLSYMVHDKEPSEGIKMLLSLAIASAELAYEIDGELINVGEYLQ